MIESEMEVTETKTLSKIDQAKLDMQIFPL